MCIYSYNAKVYGGMCMNK